MDYKPFLVTKLFRVFQLSCSTVSANYAHDSKTKKILFPSLLFPLFFRPSNFNHTQNIIYKFNLYLCDASSWMNTFTHFQSSNHPMRALVNSIVDPRHETIEYRISLIILHACLAQRISQSQLRENVRHSFLNITTPFLDQLDGRFTLWNDWTFLLIWSLPHHANINAFFDLHHVKILCFLLLKHHANINLFFYLRHVKIEDYISN